jgi:3'(2'), 5'-bisphosphate nucleotidase
LTQERTIVVYGKERQVALEAVTEAAQLCAAVRTEMAGADALQKGDRSPVTVADFGSQALVCRSLMTSFPRDTIVAEEDANSLKMPENALKLTQVTHYVRRLQPQATPESICEWIDRGNGAVTERYWTLDPIDGTKGFLRNDQYAIALALVEGGAVKVGALACPALPLRLDDPGSQTGVLFIAVQGEGAAMASLSGDAFLPIHVASAPEKTRLRFVESVEAAHGNQALQAAIAQAVGITRPALRMDSQAKYGAVARGDAVLYLRLPSTKSPDYRENIWDHAAGALIVEEAGGRVTDMHGQPLDFATDYKMRNNRGVVVSNGTMHAATLEALAQGEPSSQR